MYILLLLSSLCEKIKNIFNYNHDYNYNHNNNDIEMDILIEILNDN